MPIYFSIDILQLAIYEISFSLYLDSSCPQGQYSDVSLLTEQCKPCPKGTHSLGGAVHYSNWTVLPPEFDTYSVKSYEERIQSAEDAGCKYVRIDRVVFKFKRE